MLESIKIWCIIPFYQRREGNSSSLLDIDDTTLKCKKIRNDEVSNSRKLIEYTMEENYRLLYDLPSLKRKKEFGKDRLRNTIIRQFGKHQAMDTFKRLPNAVCLIPNDKFMFWKIQFLSYAIFTIFIYTLLFAFSLFCSVAFFLLCRFRL